MEKNTQGTISREEVMAIFKQIETRYGEDLPLFVVGMISQLHSFKTVMTEIEKTAFFNQKPKLSPFKALLHIQHIIKRLHNIPKIDIDNKKEEVASETPVDAIPEVPINVSEEKETSNESPNGE